jgi:hypothetical protein
MLLVKRPVDAPIRMDGDLGFNFEAALQKAAIKTTSNGRERCKPKR